MTSTEANHHALSRLAHLLRRRYSSESGRDFVVLAVNGDGHPRASSDELVTQQMPTFRNAR